jgi:hypothetical protein
MTLKLKGALVSLYVAALLTANALAISAYASSFNRSCSVTGAAARQLSGVLSTCGFTGANQLQELTVINPSGAANNLYVGQSDVDASNGVELLPGTSITYRAASQQDVIDATRIYLYVSSTQNSQLSARSK